MLRQFERLCTVQKGFLQKCPGAFSRSAPYHLNLSFTSLSLRRECRRKRPTKVTATTMAYWLQITLSSGIYILWTIRSSREERRCLPSLSLRFTTPSHKRVFCRVTPSRMSLSRERLWTNVATPKPHPDCGCGGGAPEAGCPCVLSFHGVPLASTGWSRPPQGH